MKQLPSNAQTVEPWQQFFSACWTEYDAMMARRRAREQKNDTSSAPSETQEAAK